MRITFTTRHTTEPTDIRLALDVNARNVPRVGDYVLIEPNLDGLPGQESSRWEVMEVVWKLAGVPERDLDEVWVWVREDQSSHWAIDAIRAADAQRFARHLAREAQR
jgi:hypothetical protein